MGPRIKLVVVFAMMVAFGPWVTASQAEAQEEVAISGLAGFTTDPGGFDVFRQTEFDAGMHAGGVLSFRLTPRLAVRGDLSRAWSSGQETGALTEPVEFDRTYYGVAIEARFPLGSVTPYGFGGGGMVSLDRSADMLSYEFTTFGGRLGAGVAHTITGAPLEIFVEGSGWFYQRETTGQGTQSDLLISGGITFTPEL